MTSKQDPRPPLNGRGHSAKTDQTDRRSGADRRRVDEGPPGGRDRRRLVEPRRPEVEELEMSPSEWAKLSAELPPPPAPPAAKKVS